MATFKSPSPVDNKSARKRLFVKEKWNNHADFLADKLAHDYLVQQ